MDSKLIKVDVYVIKTFPDRDLHPARCIKIKLDALTPQFAEGKWWAGFGPAFDFQ